MAAALAGCKVSVNTGGDGGRRLEGAGVAFVVPMETGKAQFGLGGINYQSNTITANTDGKQLTVNGLSYGALQAGDVVSLTDPSTIKVNGQPRVAGGG
ncbi:hypothetical protein SDC9_61597 [bioreactor metagenome]|uniref:Uncharacterized protein n=1 Tax=bioreactor metagenome TaxID=1076179 RepID=A0A644XG61_9ZZZZ